MNDLELVKHFSDGTPISREDLRIAEQRGLIADRGNGYILTNKGSDLLLGSKPVEPMEVSFEEPLPPLDKLPKFEVGSGLVSPPSPTFTGKSVQDIRNIVARNMLDMTELPNLAECIKPVPSALDVQVGGGHYKDMKIQPVEFITANNLGFLAGCVIKRICRYKAKNGIEDLEKAKHEIDLLIELELKNGN